MNLKGGVGKTVTALTLADVLRRAGKTSVIVDCDGQMGLTRFCLPDFDPDNAPSVADVLRRHADLIEPEPELTTTRNGKFKTKYGNRVPLCECCGYSIGDKRYNYCPNCGAKVVE